MREGREKEQVKKVEGKWGEREGNTKQLREGVSRNRQEMNLDIEGQREVRGER